MQPILLSALRRRLTALYLLVGLTLVIIVGGASYGLLRYYFDATTDLTLRHELAGQLQVWNIPVPPDIAAADALWARGLVSAPPQRTDKHDDKKDRKDSKKDDGDKLLDRDSAAIYTLPLDATGQIIPSNGPAPPPVAPDLAAVAAARASGSDVRTIWIANDLPVRLLTYRVDRADGPAFLQLGRLTVDYDRILQGMVMGLVALGAVSTVALAAASWLLAGRSIRPAQEAWDRQLGFIASAGHELRAPLTLLRATADVALRELPAGEAQSDQREYWTDVVHDCDHLARLVDDLLLLSRLDARQLRFTIQATPLEGIFADLARQVGRLATEQGVRLSIGSTPAVALVDAERLRQILLILLDNALRHTPRGGEIRLDATPRNGSIRLAVADTGEGIPPEHLSRLFDRFYVVDGARRRGGSGLGLSIARALVTAQRGTISITSKVGAGTRVEVTIPQASRV